LAEEKMKVGIASQSTIWILRVVYVALVALGAILWNYVGLVVSLVAVYLIDRLWPKWASDLSWSDIHMGICNLAAFGVNGARLHLHFGQKRLFVYKDHKSEKLRLAVAVFAAEWEDIFDTQRKAKDFAKENNAVYYCERTYRHRTCIFKPNGDLISGTFSIIQSLVVLAGESLTPSTLAAIDSPKRFAWRKYPDVEYPEIEIN
jgi:hypothetical protein